MEIRSHPSSEWLEAMGGFQNHAKTLRDTYRRIVESIVIPAAFLAHREEGEITALAYGAVHDGLLCCESVITGARHRGRGHARRALESLFGWARGLGTTGVCLQVEATNNPAIALYRSLGLSTELYRYHYRREPAGSACSPDGASA